MTKTPEQTVVISGVGQSAIGRWLDTSEFRLTLDAVSAAISDAGLTTGEIDGLGWSPGPGATFAPGFAGPDLLEIQDALGIDTQWQQGSITAVYDAVLAVASGVCRHAVVYRTITEGSRHHRAALDRAPVGSIWKEADGVWQYTLPVGALSPANLIAMYARRHMHEYGVTREQLGWLAITQRVHAGLNPDAVFKTPLTLDEYMAARPISTPLCLLDCDVPVDASTAFVISSIDTVSALRRPVRFEALAMTCAGRPSMEQWEDMTTMAAHGAAAQMWSRTDLKPSDVDVAELYDGFSYLAMMWLEALGFCGPGESGAFVDGGKRIALGGDLPINTWGGQLSAGRVHNGFGHLAEAVRQLRNEAGPRQVPNAQVAAVSSGGGSTGHCVLLTRT